MPEPITRRRHAMQFLSAEQKYEICLKMITGELASREAVAQAKVDRSTIVTLRETGKDVAIAGFQALWPGHRHDVGEASELARLQAEAQLFST